jgi:alkanesulfonate monooxygenase SsuD/methylene tetrahydromethanopterin reductase-like flavin-dependent oxidoreductase (luciferase family)
MDLGIFMMPVHPQHRPLADVYAEDCEKIVLADKLGFTSAWVGEHMTAPTEPVTAPLLILANVLAQTSQIKLAPGVLNIPIHHPVIVAGELAQLDHMSRGRVIFGIGPGSLASDWEIFGTGDAKVREEKTLESVDLILRMWTENPPYRFKGKYWDLTLEKHIVPDLGIGEIIKPYQKPHPRVAMSVMSPFSGSAKTAGLRGWIPISSNFSPEYSVASHWKRYLEGCEQAKREPEEGVWYVVRSMLVARTDEEAHEIAHSADGALRFYYDYLWRGLKVGNHTQAIKPDPKMPDEAVTVDTLIDALVIYGSPKTVADKLVAFRERVGPFGHLVQSAVDWSGRNRDWEQTSMRLLAEEVLPRINKSLALSAPPERKRAASAN